MAAKPRGNVIAKSLQHDNVQKDSEDIKIRLNRLLSIGNIQNKLMQKDSEGINIRLNRLLSGGII